MTRDGTTYDHARDGVRLGEQHKRVWKVMRRGHWKTIAQVAAITGDQAQSVAARIRDFRKPKFGGHDIQSKYVGDGVWMYRVVK